MLNREHDPRGGCIRKPGCKPYWVANRTYTAECPPGMTGGPVTARVQYISEISLQDAQFHALRLAKAKAESEIHCCWKETACVQHPEEIAIADVISNFEENLSVSYLHDPPIVPVISQQVRIVLPDDDFFEAEVVSTQAPGTIIISVNPGFSLPEGTQVLTKPIICCEVCSTVSPADALNRAQECAEEQQYNLETTGELLPIGHFFLS